jgi:urease accessory protein
MLIVETRAPADAVAGERLPLGFDARCKTRLRTRLESGEEVGLFLDRGTVLRGGDKLTGHDGRVVEVIALAEPLMEVACDDALLLARAAYHLGNRHVAVQIEPGRLRFAADHVLGEMVAGLGFAVTQIVAPFEPEGGAYGSHGGHSHGHDADGEGGKPRIHEFVKP